MPPAEAPALRPIEASKRRMPELSSIASTYKAHDTEELIDRFLYRPAGYGIALLARKTGIKPNTVTFSGLAAGAAGGHMFYYQDGTLILFGVFLLMLSQALDGADGQLARMTGQCSTTGRILDGFSTNVVFLSVYIHLCLRLMNEGATLWIFAPAAAAGASHSAQSAVADYFRNAYLYFAHGRNRSELDSSDRIRQAYSDLSPRGGFFEKFLTRIYLNYTLMQERYAPGLRRLLTAIGARYGKDAPDWLGRDYAAGSRPLLKYYNMLTTNTRMIALFIALAANRPLWYFLFEILALNAMLAGVLYAQHRLINGLIDRIETDMPSRVG